MRAKKLKRAEHRGDGAAPPSERRRNHRVRVPAPGGDKAGGLAARRRAVFGQGNRGLGRAHAGDLAAACSAARCAGRIRRAHEIESPTRLAVQAASSLAARKFGCIAQAASSRAASPCPAAARSRASCPAASSRAHRHAAHRRAAAQSIGSRRRAAAPPLGKHVHPDSQRAAAEGMPPNMSIPLRWSRGATTWRGAAPGLRREPRTAAHRRAAAAHRRAAAAHRARAPPPIVGAPPPPIVGAPPPPIASAAARRPSSAL